jgi:hypothetical protein
MDPSARRHTANAAHCILDLSATCIGSATLVQIAKRAASAVAVHIITPLRVAQKVEREYTVAALLCTPIVKLVMSTSTGWAFESGFFLFRLQCCECCRSRS